MIRKAINLLRSQLNSVAYDAYIFDRIWMCGHCSVFSRFRYGPRYEHFQSDVQNDVIVKFDEYSFNLGVNFNFSNIKKDIWRLNIPKYLKIQNFACLSHCCKLYYLYSEGILRIGQVLSRVGKWC